MKLTGTATPTSLHPVSGTIKGPALDLAWAAGFTDGEGCISAVWQKYQPPRRPSLRVRFSIAQNDRQVLEHLQRIISAPTGAIYAVQRTLEQNRQGYVLAYDGPGALFAIERLRPFLVRKRLEADACMELKIAGRLGVRPGPKGFPPSVVKAREFWFKKLQALK